VGAVLRVSVCEACCVGVESFARTASGPAHVPKWRVSHTVPRSATCSWFLHAVFNPTDHCTNCNTHSLPVAHTHTQLTPDEIRRLGSWGIEYLEGGITRPSSPDVDGGSGRLTVL
jgi:hypothetical protein